MATVYSRGSSRLSRIASPPTYGASLSRYSAQLRAAITDMDKATTDQLVLAYQNGNMTFDDFQKALKGHIDSLPQGSLVQVDAQTALVNAQKQEQQRQLNLARSTLEAQAPNATPQEKFNIENKLLSMETPGTDAYVQQQQKAIKALDDYQTQKVLDLRQKLIDEKTKGGKGLSTQDLLDINTQLLKVADPGSTIYNQLGEQRQTLQSQIGSEQKAAGKVGMTNDARDKLSQIIATERDADLAYQQGQISGLTRDQARLQDAKEAYQILTNLANSGVSVSESNLTSAQEAYSDAQKFLQLRQSGQLFDVVDNNGKVVAVTQSGLTFQTNPNTGKTELVKSNYENYNVKFNPASQSWQVLDANGNVLQDNLPSQSAANNVAKQDGAYTFNVIMTGADGKTSTKLLARDPKTGAFYNPKNPSEVYSHIPQSADDYGKAAFKNVPANWLTDPNAQALLKSQVDNYVAGKPENLDLSGYNQNSNTGSNNSGSGKSFFDNLGDFVKGGLQDVANNPLVGGIVNAGKLGAGIAEGLGQTDLGKTVGEGFNELGTTLHNDIGDIGNVAGEAVKSALNSNPLTAPFGAIGQIASSQPVQQALSSAQANLGPIFNQLGTNVHNIASDVGSGIGSAFSGLGSALNQNAYAAPSTPSQNSSSSSGGFNFSLPSLPSLPDFKLPAMPTLDLNFNPFPKQDNSQFFLTGLGDIGSGIANSGLGKGVGSAFSGLGSAVNGAFNDFKNFLGF